MSRLARFTIVITAAIITIFAFNAGSQATATISGVITDSSGSVLPGVTVSIAKNCRCRSCASRCDCCPAARTIVTGAQGSYTFGGIEPGEYSVRAELAGFRPASADSITIGVGQSKNVNLTLETDGESLDVSR